MACCQICPPTLSIWYSSNWNNDDDNDDNDNDDDDDNDENSDNDNDDNDKRNYDSLGQIHSLNVFCFAWRLPLQLKYNSMQLIQNAQC